MLFPNLGELRRDDAAISLSLELVDARVPLSKDNPRVLPSSSLLRILDNLAKLPISKRCTALPLTLPLTMALTVPMTVTLTVLGISVGRHCCVCLSVVIQGGAVDVQEE